MARGALCSLTITKLVYFWWQGILTYIVKLPCSTFGHFQINLETYSCTCYFKVSIMSINMYCDYGECGDSHDCGDCGDYGNSRDRGDYGECGDSHECSDCGDYGDYDDAHFLAGVFKCTGPQNLYYVFDECGDYGECGNSHDCGERGYYGDFHDRGDCGDYGDCGDRCNCGIIAIITTIIITAIIAIQHISSTGTIL